jgi:AraC-like DNA-binding protein
MRSMVRLPVHAPVRQMALTPIRPHPSLAPIVARVWHFEGPDGFPVADLKTVVPNGLVKLIIPYHGTLRSERGDALLRNCPAAEIAVVGIQDRPVIIDSPGPVAVIGIELRADAAYRLLGLRLSDLTNHVVLADDIGDLKGARAGLREQLEAAETVADRVRAVEDFLLRLLAVGRTAKPVVSSAVHLLAQHHGAIRIEELCRRLGYSRRHLASCFEDQVGVAPKTLAAILRFQHAFRVFRADVRRGATPLRALDLYADQSHFIREFKRFSGRAPTAYLSARNEFGDLFYGT